MSFIKGGLLFAGGVVLGGVVATKTTLIVVSEEIQKVLDDHLNDRKKKNPHFHYVSYMDYKKQQRDFSRGNRIEEIIFERRGDAEEVLNKMDEIIGNYGYVTVADFYELSGITSSYESAKYGWTDLKTADVHRVRDGYILQLPRAKYFD